MSLLLGLVATMLQREMQNFIKHYLPKYKLATNVALQCSECYLKNKYFKKFTGYKSTSATKS